MYGQKPPQYCKVINLQLIKINGKKKENFLVYLINIKHSTYSNFAHYQLTAYIKKALSNSNYKNSNFKIIYIIYIFILKILYFVFMKQTFIVHLTCAYSFEQNRNDSWLNEMWEPVKMTSVQFRRSVMSDSL